MVGSAADFIGHFEVWARKQPDIRSAFVVGSFGRKQATEWSDLDLAFITKKAQRYAQPRNWLGSLGEVWAAIYDPSDPLSGLPTSASLFCSFADGITVDFSILPQRRTWLWARAIRNPLIRQRFLTTEAGEAAYLFRQGIQILFDHDGLISRLSADLQSAPVQLESVPSPERLQALSEDFYLGVVQMVRYLMRGRTFAAQIVRDRPVRRCLITLAQWHAQARQQDWNNPLLYRDKYVERWADARFVQAMPVLFNSYGGETLWQSVQTSLMVFGSLLRELAVLQRCTIDDRTLTIGAWIEEQYRLWQSAQGVVAE